jgi:putative ABC transport system ATP-binding protein
MRIEIKETVESIECGNPQSASTGFTSGTIRPNGVPFGNNPQSCPPCILTVDNLFKSYGRGPARVEVLHGLGLSVRQGEFLAVMGPSGCGKSTLLHLLGLMDTPDRGRIVFQGQDANASAQRRMMLRRRSIGFVFQRFNLLGELGAADNVRLSLRVRALTDDGRADELFDKLGVAHVKRRKPGQMSIGEQQRVAVVRALAHRPVLLLADEPTGNLDSRNSQVLLDHFRAINRADGQTIVMITHSAEAAACADRTIRMKDGQIVE